jgi:hypothetical protein
MRAKVESGKALVRNWLRAISTVLAKAGEKSRPKGNRLHRPLVGSTACCSVEVGGDEGGHHCKQRTGNIGHSGGARILEEKFVLS